MDRDEDEMLRDSLYDDDDDDLEFHITFPSPTAPGASKGSGKEGKNDGENNASDQPFSRSSLFHLHNCAHYSEKTKKLWFNKNYFDLQNLLSNRNLCYKKPCNFLS